MAKKKFELTEGEWAIMLAVWELEPCAAPTVQEHLEDTTEWTYSTVKTMLDRMVKKGLLKTKKLRNLYLYRSVITHRQAQKGEVMRALKRAFDGAFTPMMQFLIDSGELSREELTGLEELIREKRSEKESGKKKK